MLRRSAIVLTAAVSISAAAAFVGQWTLAGGCDMAGAVPEGTGHRIGFTAHPIGGIGADLITGAITGPTNFGGLAGVSAYSMGHTKCNVGDQIISVVASTNQHPIHASGIHRVTPGGASGGASGPYSRIEQIGQSWVWHNFCSLQQGLCGACTSCGGGCPSCLGVGCSDPNTSTRQGQQNILGPRADINAANGAFTYPLAVISMTGNVLFKRIQVPNADLDPALNPGATYFGENMIVSPQDALAGNGANNASHIRMLVGALSGTAPNQFYQLSLSGATIRELPAIHAWKTIDPSVTIVNVDVPLDGRFVVAHDVTNLGSGRWHYEYAIYNLSSHRSAEKFIVPVHPAATVINAGFHDVDYHSQSVLPAAMQVDNLEWQITIDSSQITWATSPYTGPYPDGNERTANALRWGTLYNFRFDADAPPVPATAVIDLFRPGVPTTMSVNLRGPGSPLPCFTDLDSSGTTNGIDLAIILGSWGSCPTSSGGDCLADLNGDGLINGLDLAIALGAWGPCT